MDAPEPSKTATPAGRRRSPLISCWNARVRHFPADPTSHDNALHTQCGKWAFFAPRGLRYLPKKLPYCKACQATWGLS